MRFFEAMLLLVVINMKIQLSITLVVYSGLYKMEQTCGILIIILLACSVKRDAVFLWKLGSHNLSPLLTLQEMQRQFFMLFA